MVKASSRKQRGLGIVRKRLILVTNTHANDITAQKRSIFSSLLQKVPFLAKKHWNFLLLSCSMCSFIPVESDPRTGWANLSPIWKRCIHYILVTMYGLIMSYQFYVTIQRFAQGQLDLLTYMCACSFIALLIAAASTLGTTWSPQALVDLFNGWKSMENVMAVQMNRRMTAFDENAPSTKVLLLAIAIHLSAVNASMFSMVGEVPTSVLTTLKKTGWLELPDYLPPIVWPLVFLPFELLTYWPPMLATGVCTMTMAMALGTMKVFAEEARKIPVKKMDDWMRVYRLRRIMQVANVLGMDWASSVATALLVCASCGIILLLYVTIRLSDLPFLVYIWIPIVAFVLMVVITWLCYDCVNIKRVVQDVDGNLELGLNRWRFRDIQMRRNTVYNRMLKSLRPIDIRLGPFTEVTPDVPINVWDEVINQLLFLLSL